MKSILYIKHFQRQLKKFRLLKIMVNLLPSLNPSSRSPSVWFAATTAQRRVIHSEERDLPSTQELYMSRTLRCADRIAADRSHHGQKCFHTLPSGKKLQSRPEPNATKAVSSPLQSAY